MKTKFIILFTCLLLQHCISFDQEVEYRIDPLLKPFVDKFYEEGAKRGIILQKNNLIASIDDRIIDRNNLGESRMVGDQIVVLINKREYNRFLANGDTIYIERLMMHELGHALLNRSHVLSFSIMNSGSYYSEYKIDSIRNSLIDELFLF